MLPHRALWVYILIRQASARVHFVPSPVGDLSSASGKALRVSPVQLKLTNVGGTLGCIQLGCSV